MDYTLTENIISSYILLKKTYKSIQLYLHITSKRNTNFNEGKKQ